MGPQLHGVEPGFQIKAAESLPISILSNLMRQNKSEDPVYLSAASLVYHKPIRQGLDPHLASLLGLLAWAEIAFTIECGNISGNDTVGDFVSALGRIELRTAGIRIRENYR